VRPTRPLAPALAALTLALASAPIPAASAQTPKAASVNAPVPKPASAPRTSVLRRLLGLAPADPKATPAYRDPATGRTNTGLSKPWMRRNR